MKFAAVEMRFPGLEMRFHGLEMRVPGLEMRVHGFEMRVLRLEMRFLRLEMRFPGLEMRFPPVETRFTRLEMRCWHATLRRLDPSDAVILDDLGYVQPSQPASYPVETLPPRRALSTSPIIRFASSTVAVSCQAASQKRASAARA